MKQLRAYDLHTIIGLLKLFLLELPEPVSSFEIYDTTKKLYGTLFTNRKWKKVMSPNG